MARQFIRSSFVVMVCCAMMLAGVASAQETINYASVSGRVTDPQGAVVPGAQVSARQTDTNVTAETVTDSEGRFRFPYLKVGPYELKVHLQGFADSTRTLTLTVGSAFDLPIALSVARTRYERHRHGRSRPCWRRREARSPARSRRPKFRACR